MTEEKKWGILCYFPVLNLVFCAICSVKMNQSKFCLFHARQGLVLAAIWIAAIFIAVISPFLSLLLWIIMLILHGSGMALAFSGQMVEIPFLGKLAMKIPEDYIHKLLTGGKKIDGGQK
ncbi:hypothetical protein HY604_00490 [Candidatus Peregrinibacteria bacterium]|nr:hypothetical protein [Candidatus Peregrinibacteria bacterium]